MEDNHTPPTVADISYCSDSDSDFESDDDTVDTLQSHDPDGPPRPPGPVKR